MWELDREFLDQQVCLTNYQPKTMINVVFGVEGIALLAILPQDWKVTSAYFQEHIFRGLAVQKDPRNRKPSTPRCILHFNNAPIHNAEEFERTLQEREFLRREYPPYSPDLSPCVHSLSGYLYEK
jgi:hypothetical protein